jgi:hypothetical protein
MQGGKFPGAGLTAISRGVSFATERPILSDQQGFGVFLGDGQEF